MASSHGAATIFVLVRRATIAEAQSLVAVQAIRRPSRAHIDIALLFGAAALVIAIAVAMLAGLLAPTEPAANLAGSAIMALPYLLLRLVDDITLVPRQLRRAVDGGRAHAAGRGRAGDDQRVATGRAQPLV